MTVRDIHREFQMTVECLSYYAIYPSSLISVASPQDYRRPIACRETLQSGHDAKLPVYTIEVRLQA